MDRECSEEKFENYFQFLSTRKNWDSAKTGGSSIASAGGAPQMYAVYILNNNNVPNDFLVELIQKFFHKSTGQSVKTALEVDKEGRALCDVYTRDTAETKVMHVLEYAQGQQQEVKCIMQKSDSHAIKKS